MPATCPYCQRHFPNSDSVNARHKAVCEGWKAIGTAPKALPCLCGHEATSLTQMKRHRSGCATWKARDRGELQMQRLATTLEDRYGAGVRNPRDLAEAEERRRQTNRERYGAENPFSSEASTFAKVQASLEGKRLVMRGADNPFADPEVQQKIRETNIARRGVENPQQDPQVRSRTHATNLERYGAAEILAAPVIREKIEETNQDRYGGPAPSCSPEVVEKARQTNLERWGVEWTAQHPEVRAKQVAAMVAKYGSHYLASDEGRAEIRRVMVEKYGVDHPAKIDGFWQRNVATFVRRYGVAHPLQLAEFLEKRRQTCLDRYGVETPLQNPEIYAKVVKTMQAHWGASHHMKNPEFAVTHLRNIRKRFAPNKLEAAFAALHPELRYTGDGDHWVWLPALGQHKNPDFILPGPNPSHPCVGINCVVEIFGDYWHSRIMTGRSNFEHESEVVSAFEAVGIRCLVVWESDFRLNPEKVRERVLAHITL